MPGLLSSSLYQSEKDLHMGVMVKFVVGLVASITLFGASETSVPGPSACLLTLVIKTMLLV